MRYGILGDIHSNLEALTVALDALDRAGVDVLVSVGDVVGYGASPAECIALLRERNARVVLGNHDAACVGRLDLILFNPMARDAVLWTREQLEEGDLSWLENLPLRLELPDCAVAHGTWSHPERFDYTSTPSDADASLDELALPVLFVGHTHEPRAFLRPHDDPLHTHYVRGSRIDLSDARRAVVNVGSVGQPRDGDPRLAVALFDSEQDRVEILRLEYDVAGAARRILDAGLPPALANRLSLGL